MGVNFVRRKENFLCKNCGFVVKGNGYTDHCPRCLWSMHVDVHPGDRASKCKGMMMPIDIEYVKGSVKIIYKCVKCDKMKKNVAAADDDIDGFLDRTE